MNDRVLGKTNIDVSILGFGAMRLPIAKHGADFSNAIALIQHAITKGITFFDVGTFYCHFQCEKVFGLATSQLPSDAILFCGKNSTHQNKAGDWQGQLQNTLSLFNRDCLDIYFLHYLDLTTWESYFIKRQIITEVLDAREKGLFRYLGFSSHDSPANVQKLVDTGCFSSVILPFNLLQQNYRDVMRHAKSKGLGVIAMNPLAGGILAQPQIFGNSVHKDKDWAALALNYVLSQPFIDCVLSGMESLEIIDRNCALCDDNRLSAEEANQIDRLMDHGRMQNWVPCTGCNYCMPCIQGIDIAKTIEIYNRYSATSGNNLLARDYHALDFSAENCIQCGDCSEKCPQKIDISNVMLLICDKFRTH